MKTVFSNKIEVFRIAICTLSFFLCLHTFAQKEPSTILQFADPLTNNMVVQQNKAFTVWGQAEPGFEVKIKADWTLPIEVVADLNGKFKGIIPVPLVQPGDFSKHTLSISSGNEEQTLNNILIGDLWICSGQSNMQFSMKEVVDAEVEVAQVNEPHIRLFNTGLNFSNKPIDTITSGQWQKATPETVKDFSAVGYYFGKTLSDSLNIPIGLLFTGIGASAAQAYVPRKVLAADPVLDSIYLQPYLTGDKYKEHVNGGFSFEKVTRPYLLYNALINPFTNLSVKGIIWYQGEANRHDRKEYTHLMYKMIESWREAFGQGNLPFYYVQVAPFFYDIEDPKMADYAFFREAQENISKMSNTEMVLTMDVGEAKNLHPKNKKPIGERLARTALNRTYEKLSVAYRGPHFESADFENGKAIIHFEPETVKSGLQTNDNKTPKFFQLAGEDQVFYSAEAKIEGNNIVVMSSKVKKPVAVRYAFTNYAVTNLENVAGLPAVPFRSDNWKEPEWEAYK